MKVLLQPGSGHAYTFSSSLLGGGGGVSTFPTTQISKAKAQLKFIFLNYHHIDQLLSDRGKCLSLVFIGVFIPKGSSMSSLIPFSFGYTYDTLYLGIRQ